jgi:uncharacterized protein with PQ loop repeat
MLSPMCGRVRLRSLVDARGGYRTAGAAMDEMIPVLAGAVSTVIFAGSTLPMLVKAARTKDLSSYSLGNIMLSNLGNVIHSIYVFHLPAGPMWVLHTFYLLSTALMLVWYLRYTQSPILRRRLRTGALSRRHAVPRRPASLARPFAGELDSA